MPELNGLADNKQEENNRGTGMHEVVRGSINNTEDQSSATPPSNTVMYQPSNDGGQIALEIKIKNAAGNFALATALLDRFQSSLITETLFRELGDIVP